MAGNDTVSSWRKVTLNDVKIGATDTTYVHLDQKVVWSGLGHGPVSQGHGDGVDRPR
jgi:hypothetical protein